MLLGRAESAGCRMPKEAQSTADYSHPAQGVAGPLSLPLRKQELIKGRMGAPDPRSSIAIPRDPLISKQGHFADLSDT